MKTLTTQQVKKLNSIRTKILEKEARRHLDYKRHYVGLSFDEIEEDELIGLKEATSNIVYNILNELSLYDDNMDLEVFIFEANIFANDNIDTIYKKIIKTL